MKRANSIAIIGAGASGTITAIQLLGNLPKGSKIYLIEKRKEGVYRGAAYSSQLNYEPLNVPAGKMSLYPDKPSDFYEWLLANKEGTAETKITPESFVSRRWYGDYLSAKIIEAVSNNPYVEFELINDEVSDFVLLDGSKYYQVSLSSGRKLSAGHIILATGNEAPSHLLSIKEQQEVGEKYLANPWVLPANAKIKASDNVLILGAGLTMVDHAISLYNQNHKGKIYAFSRHGLMPLAHDETKKFEFHFTETADLRELVKQIRKSIDEAAAKNINWQSVLDAIRLDTTALWKSLSTNSKQAFLKRLRSYWEIHRHRMPQTSALIINKMIEDGKLTILSGTYQNVEVKEGVIHFNYKQKNKGGLTTVKTNHIINCIGGSGDYANGKNILLKSLLARGWAVVDELKLGIETGKHGAIIKHDGTILKNVYSIGPLRKAAEWETTAIREIRQQALEIAEVITTEKIEKPVLTESFAA